MRIRLFEALLMGMALSMTPAWGVAGIQWDESWQVRMNGQRLSVEAFSSSMPPDAVARDLAGLNQGYERYLIGDGRIILSGFQAGRHWVAEVQGSPQGSKGYVSALYFDLEQLQSSGPALGEEAARTFALHGLTHAGPGLAGQSFEFDSSVFVGLTAPGQGRPKDAPLPDSLTLIPSENQNGLAVAISMPER